VKDLIDVLVVGAGPVGLALGCDLRIHGLAMRAIERAPTPATTSRALGVQARTLEILENLGVVEPVLARGLRLTGLNAFVARRRQLHVPFEGVDTPYPFAVILPQSETERVLADHFAALGGTVERGCELESFTQDADGVTSVLRHADGLTETVRSAWLVGCDGAHSTVRRRLGIPFEGSALESQFVLADLAITGSLVESQANGFLHASGVLGFFPLGAGSWRLVAQVPLGDDAVDDPTLPELQAIADERGPGDLRLSDPSWLSHFRINERRVQRYREGRVLLAGDAAHIHSPVGGQGMNTGIGDAYNLGWKLAWVVSGVAPPSLLDSYEAERSPIAEDVLRTTGTMTRAITTRSPFVRRVRNTLMALVTRLPPLTRAVATRIAELDVAYRHSPIVGESWAPGIYLGGPRAGERAPDGRLRDADRGDERRLFEVLRGTRHTLLSFVGRWPSRDGNAALEAVAAAVDRKLGERVSIHTVVTDRAPRAGLRSPTWIDPEGRLHRRYAASGPSVYLVRPDGYVGFRGRPPQPDAVVAYFDRLSAAGSG